MGCSVEVVTENQKQQQKKPKQTEKPSRARNSFCFLTFSFKFMNKQKSVDSEHLWLASLRKENARVRTRPVLKVTGLMNTNRGQWK